MGRPKKEQPNHGNFYEVKITIGKDMRGKPIRKSFYSAISKADAKRKAERFKVEQAVSMQIAGSFVTKEKTFKEWATIWLEVYKKPNVSENTYLWTYQKNVEKHLVPYFGEKLMTDISPLDIQEFFNCNLSASESTLDKFRLCLSGIFDTAVENEICYRNPVKRITYVSEMAKNEKKVYGAKEIKIVEAAAEGSLPEVVLILETGLRRGEVMGLRASDVDLEKGTLSVNRSIAVKQGGGVTVEPPKWGSYRTLPLSTKALSVLKVALLNCTGDDYIFPLKNGHPQNPNTWSQKLDRFMDKLQKDHPEIERLTAHELRHTYATDLRRKNVDLLTIQTVMGHKDAKITSGIYVHTELEVLKKALGYDI